MPDSAAPVPPANPLRRRSIVTAAAWSVPTVAVVVSAPSAAASTPPEPVGPPDLIDVTGFESVRCDVVPAGTVVFRALDGTSPAAKGGAVAVTLPPGLSFSAGGTSAVVVVGEEGVVSVPAFTASGSAGSYTITAAYGTATAVAQGTVTAKPGQVVELTRSPGDGNQAPRFSAAAVPGLVDGVHGAISGDELAGSAGRNAAVITAGGQVHYWGANVGAPVTAPGTLLFSGTPVTGMVFVDTWTCAQAGNTSTGGIAAGIRPDAVYQWARTGTGAGPLTVVAATGISGTVLAAESNDGYSYVLTSSGLHWWANATSGDRVTATLIADTAGATAISTWSHRRANGELVFGGGVLLADGGVSLWSGSHALAPSVGAPADIVEFQAGQASTYALTGSGELWTQGVAFAPSAGGTSWTLRAADVSTSNAWSFEGYTGGVYVTTAGAAVQFMAAQPAGGIVFRTEAKTLAAGVSLTKVFSTDGTYFALASNATVYAWGGNLDNAGRSQPVLVAGVTDATDLNAWGFHGPSYVGGGYVISSTGC